MNKKVVKFLKVIRVLDSDGNLSITNLAVVAALYNLMTCHDMSVEAVGTFLAALVGYNVKRFAKPSNTPEADEMEALKEALHKLETSVTAIKMANSPTRRR